MRAAAKAASDLVDLMPPQDFPHPQKVMAAIVAIFARHHQHVIERAPVEIASQTERLTLKVVSDVCDRLQDDVSGQIARERPLELPAPEHRDQARREGQVSDYETRIRPMLAASMQSVPADDPRKTRDDGRHAQRVTADLEARRVRSASTEHPGNARE